MFCICKLKIIIISILCLFSIHCSCQGRKLSDDSYISLLTCSSGSELYSVFGHSAIRVKDDSLNIDLVFNYGTFDFDTPNFYLKFMNGDLDYMLAYNTFGRFKMAYEHENRSVVEGVLELTTTEKQQLWDYLCWNIQEENRYYRYDFFFDNCATRLRDIVFKAKRIDPLKYNSTDSLTFRDYIHAYVNEDSWTAQGIDLLLGTKTDKYATVNERAYLPDYLDSLFTEANLYRSKQTIVNSSSLEQDSKFTLYPIVVSFVVLIFIILFTIVELVYRRYFTILDIILFSVCLLLSLLFWYLWLFTKHDVCSININVLWASIIYLPMLYLLFTKYRQSILMAVMAMLNIAFVVLFLLLSIIGVQDVPSMTIPLCLALILRNLRLIFLSRCSSEK